MRLWDLITEERPLAMVWLLEKQGRSSWLVGSAHFFPYKFRRALEHLLREARVLLLEGPLELGDLRQVAQKGLVSQEGGLSPFLDEVCLARLHKVLGPAGSRAGELMPGILSLGPSQGNTLKSILDSMQPWMAFFTLWVSYLERLGWIYHMDRDGLHIGKRMGCQVIYLECLEEQIQALEQIPKERIVSFLKAAHMWKNYSGLYVRLYLRGDLQGLLGLSGGFPSRCPAVIDRRDRLLYERMLPYLEKGGAVALVGAPHTKAILGWLDKEGYLVRQVRVA
ncbi:MAG: TraB/GumN family protein [bacterium]